MAVWRLIVLGFVSFFISVPSLAVGEADIIVDHARVYEVGGGTRYIEDPDGTLTISEMIQRKASLDWAEVETPIPNFGFTESTYWLSLPFETGPIEKRQWLFEIEYPLLDDIEFYVLQNGKIYEQFQTGDKYIYAQRPIDHRNFLFPLELAPYEQYEVLIRVQSTSSIQIPLVLSEHTKYWEDQQLGLMWL